jgi:ferredoxin
METENSFQRRRNAMARDKALANAGDMHSASVASVTYQSRGRVLLIGGEQALLFAPRLLPELKPEVLVTDGSDEPSVPAIAQAGRELQVRGHLGRFEVELGNSGQRDHEILKYDLLLDLAPEPLLQTELKPPGYYRPDSSSSPEALDALADQLKQMVGTFEKPRYFEYDADRCAHVRNGVVSCTRCIDACPAGAITSIAEGIEVDPYLCQGGGACAATCPSGAIGYTMPLAESLQERLRRMLKTYRDEGGRDAVVVFMHEGSILDDAENTPNVLPVAVEELASVGPELILGALAYGASCVQLLDDGDVPPSSRHTLEDQLQWISTVLDSLGYAADAVRLVAPGDTSPSAASFIPETFEPAWFSPAGDKRQRLFGALDHLHEQAPRPVPMVTLDAGAPFGTAGIDENTCTLCMACVGACPGHALQSAGDTPGIDFLEANCLQCGMCARTCPEDAIWISPRLLLDRGARSRPRPLYHEAPFECIECGKPFATRRMIELVLDRLQDNPMFATQRARNRLMMCENCRVVDMAKDEQSQLFEPAKGEDYAG